MFHNPASMRAIAERYTAAWCSSGRDERSGFLCAGWPPDHQWGDVSRGREAITEAVRSLMTAFPDLRVIMNDVAAKEDCVEYHWALMGTNTGRGGTGRAVHIRGVERWQIAEDELIASSEGQFDEAEYLRQLE